MSGSISFAYDDAVFRATFPFFANTTTFPEAVLAMNFTNGMNYIGGYNYGFLANANRQYALYLMTAHLTWLNNIIASNDGAPVMVEISARIDKIAVTAMPPPLKSQWQYWLSTTAWGQQLLAQLQGAAAGGWYIGGLPERAAFRRVGGGFGGAL